MSGLSLSRAKGYSCPQCRREFQRKANYDRHLKRQTQCTELKEPTLTCENCASSFRHQSGLSRHRKQCSDRQKQTTPRAEALSQPMVIQTVNNVHNTVQNFQVNTVGVAPSVVISPNTVSGPVTAFDNNPGQMRGWPERWPLPEIEPYPFRPPGFEISLEQLTSAVSALPERIRDECRRGEASAVTRLLIEILRQVHSDPKERNVYVNPRRCDQALVYIPSHWITCQLDEAGQTLYQRIASLLETLPRTAQPDIRTLAKATQQSCERGITLLAKMSRAALAAHLESVRQSTLAGEDWLGIGTDDNEQLSFFLREWTGHLQPDMLAIAAENAAGLYSVDQVTIQTGKTLAALAVTECARYLIHGRTRNLTIIPGEGEHVYVHRREGWALQPKKETAAALLRKISTILDDQLEDVKNSPLLALRPWLRERLPEVEELGVADKILDSYAAVAARYYRDLPALSDVLDRREIARRLLAANMVSLTDTLPDAPICHQLGPNSGVLSVQELESIIGFSLSN